MAQKRIDVIGCIRVDLLGQSAHGVERTEGVAIGQIFEALVGPFVALALEFDDVVLAVTRQLLTEYLAPVDLHQQEALRDVEGARKFVDRSICRQASLLIVVELNHDTRLPKVSAVSLYELVNNVWDESL